LRREKESVDLMVVAHVDYHYLVGLHKLIYNAELSEGSRFVQDKMRWYLESNILDGCAIYHHHVDVYLLNTYSFMVIFPIALNTSS